MPDPIPSPEPKRDSVDTGTATSQSDVIARPASPRRALDKIPRQFGRYRIDETLGRGGMGAVFRAYDSQLDRQVALKIPFLGDDDNETRQRFYREARAAATLQHAFICPVFDVGEFQGIPYLTMAFIEGRSLNQSLTAGQTFTIPQIALMVRKMALAMQEAHNRGVVHRDLKPANVLLRANGDPVIMDFGLARRADDKRSHGLTQEGDILGTLDYMSPEQAEGIHANVGPPSDIYGLGAILYELLCGRRPFTGNTAAMLVQILTKEPPRPGEVRPGVPARLEEICLKAMAKKPEDRFPNMAAFAAALGEFLRALQQGGAAATVVTRPSAPSPATEAPSTPRPAGANTQVIVEREAQTPARPSARSAPRSAPRSSRKGPRSGKRRPKKSSPLPLILGGAVALMALLVVGIVTAAMLWPKKDQNVVLAPTSHPTPPAGFRPAGGGPPPVSTPPRVTNPGRPNTTGGAPPARPGFAVVPQPDNVTLSVGQPQRVTLKLDRKDYRGAITLRFNAPRELRVTPPGPVTVQANQPDPVLTLRVLSQPPNENLRLDVSASYDQEPQRGAVVSSLAVRAAAGACLRVVEPALKGNFAVQSIAFAPDLSVALVGGGSGKSDGGGAPAPGGVPAPPGGPGGPGGQNPGAALEGNAIQILNLERSEVIGALSGHRDRVTGMVVAADGKSALSFGADDSIMLWDLAQGKLAKQSPKQVAHVLNIALSPDGKRGLLLLAGALIKFNPETFLPMPPHQYLTARLAGSALPDALRAVALSAEGKALVGGLEGKLLLLEMPDKSKVAAPKALVGHDEAVLCIAFDPTGRVAASGGGGVLKAGTLQPGKDNAVRLWDVNGQSLTWKADGHSDSILCLSFSSDGSLLASGAADGSVRIWRVADGKPVATFTGHAGRVLGVAFAPDGKTVWSGGADKTLRQWRLP